MAYSIQTAVSDGTLEVLDLSIKYMDKSHIFVYVDDVLVDGSAYSYVWLTDTRIQVVPAVASGSTLKVIRKTLTDEMWHEFSKGARFSTTSMDDNFEQLLFLAQEYSEGVYISDFYEDVDLHLKRIMHLGDPLNDGDAVNLRTLKEYLPNAELIPSIIDQVNERVPYTELAATTGAALVGYRANYTVEEQLNQTVEYARYLAAPSATPTSAFNAAVSALMASGGGRLKIKAGSYNLALDQIAANVPNLVIEGDGMYNTHLVFPKSAGTAMKFDGGNRVFFKNIHVTGYDNTGNYFATSSIGIDTAADIIGENAWFDGFANLFSWRGGFYHRFYGCRFTKAQYCFKGFNANNFQLHAPRITEVDYVGDFNAGSGPVVIFGGSIEKWTSSAFTTSGGARPHITIIGTYIENYPSATAGNGLAKANYQGAFLAAGFGSITLMYNMGSMNGIRRLVANGGIDTRSIVSVGNEWQYQKGAGSDTDYFFVYQNLENGLFRDSLRNNITGQTGGYTPAYRTGSMLKPEAVTGYDPIADAVIYSEPPWVSATLLNGWLNDDVVQYESASYKKIGNRVFLRGYIKGASATSGTIMTLPTGYYDDKNNVLATATLSGTPAAVVLRVLSNGNLVIQNTAYTTVGAFSLDGLSFSVD